MHPSALNNGRRFRDTYCEGRRSLRIVEVGAQDVNGSLRDLFVGQGDYVGVDFVEGRGVDLVLEDPYRLPFDDASIDVLLSSSVLEHSQFFWLLFLEMLRVLKPEGLLYLNAPSNGSFHRYPVDCWRFYPDSAEALVAWAERSGYSPALLESYIADQQGAEWNDCVTVFVRNAEHASKYPRRILDAFQDYRNGCLAGREGFLKQRDRTQDQELLRLAKKQSKVPPNGHLVATATSKHKPSETIWRWALDTPSNDAVAFDDQTLVRISGWVLLSVPDQEPRVVVRSNDRTASWPLNVERPDVVEALADAAIPAGALRLCCGFGRRMTLRDGFDLGFEIDGVIHWVGHYPLTGGPIAAV